MQPASLLQDPLRNTVFSIHMYGVFETAASIQNYLSHFVNAGLPLVIGEFGHLHTDGDPDEDTILASAQAYGIGYLGWSWSGNCCGGEYLDMVVDFNPNQETPWGTRIIHGANGILQTSVEASVYSGDRNPVVSSIRPGRPNPTAATTVNFTVTFSEPVTGVDTTAPFNDLQGQRGRHQLHRDDGAAEQPAGQPPTGCPGTTTSIWIRSCGLPTSAAPAATVHVFIGGQEMPGSPSRWRRARARKSFPGSTTDR